MKWYCCYEVLRFELYLRSRDDVIMGVFKVFKLLGSRTYPKPLTISYIFLKKTISSQVSIWNS